MTRKRKPQPKPKSKQKPRPATPLPIPEHWSDEQALAVFDFCSALQELIWRRYRHALIDPTLQAQFQGRGSNQTDTRTYPLPLDDDAPF